MNKRLAKPRRYWESYGGVRSLIRSPYLITAAVITLLIYPFWKESLWVEVAYNVFPDLLGFTLGGFAIFVAFGNEKFSKLITGDGPDGAVSPLLEISAKFAHFIFVQIFSLIYSIVFCALRTLEGFSWRFLEALENYLHYGTDFFSYIGALGTIYALILAVAATTAIFRIIALYDLFESQNPSGRE
jgi:hypothetical protein